jgi:hypothetical protein
MIPFGDDIILYLEVPNNSTRRLGPDKQSQQSNWVQNQYTKKIQLFYISTMNRLRNQEIIPFIILSPPKK